MNGKVSLGDMAEASKVDNKAKKDYSIHNR